MLFSFFSFSLFFFEETRPAGGGGGIPLPHPPRAPSNELRKSLPKPARKIPKNGPVLIKNGYKATTSRSDGVLIVFYRKGSLAGHDASGRRRRPEASRRGQRGSAQENTGSENLGKENPAYCITSRRHGRDGLERRTEENSNRRSHRGSGATHIGSAEPAAPCRPAQTRGAGTHVQKMPPGAALQRAEAGERLRQSARTTNKWGSGLAEAPEKNSRREN